MNDGRITGADTLDLIISPSIDSDAGAYDLVITWLGCDEPARSNPAAAVVIPAFCAGDADGNGIVNFADITSVLANWLGMCP